MGLVMKPWLKMLGGKAAILHVKISCKGSVNALASSAGTFLKRDLVIDFLLSFHRHLHQAFRQFWGGLHDVWAPGKNQDGQPEIKCLQE